MNDIMNVVVIFTLYFLPIFTGTLGVTDGNNSNAHLPQNQYTCSLNFEATPAVIVKGGCNKCINKQTIGEVLN